MSQCVTPEYSLTGASVGKHRFVHGRSTCLDSEVFYVTSKVPKVRYLSSLGIFSIYSYQYIYTRYVVQHTTTENSFPETCNMQWFLQLNDHRLGGDSFVPWSSRYRSYSVCAPLRHPLTRPYYTNYLFASRQEALSIPEGRTKLQCRFSTLLTNSMSSLRRLSSKGEIVQVSKIVFTFSLALSFMSFLPISSHNT